MKEKNFSKIKRNKPVSIIIHSTNILGFNLAKTLSEQGSKVILIDEFDSKSKKDLLELKKIGDIDFVDIKGLEDLMQNIGKVDYLFYIQSDFLLSNQLFESKDFLEESNNLNLCLKVTQKYKAKFSLITAITFNEKLIHAMENLNYTKPSPYSAEELQKYSETLVAEYHDKSKINARILRIGTILGKENNVDQYPQINQLFEDSVRSNSINIHGEGLDINYLININDAIFGILKLTFSEQTNGEVISLCNNNDYTILSIAYKLLELNPEATEIKFVPETEKKPVLYTQYIPAPNADNYGWKQRVNLEESMSETLQEKYQQYDKEWKKEMSSESAYKQKLEEIRQSKTQPNKGTGKISNVVKTPIGELFTKIFKPFSKEKKDSSKKSFNWKGFLTKSVFLIVFLFIFYFLLFPIIAIGISGYSAYKNANHLHTNHSNLEKEEFRDNLEDLNKNLNRLNQHFGNLQWLFSVSRQDEIYENTSMLLYALSHGTEGALVLHTGIQPLMEYSNEFEPALDFQTGTPRTTREYTDLLREIDNNAPQIEESIYKIAKASELIDQIDFDIYPQSLQRYTQKIEEYKEIIDSQIIPLQKVVSFLPDVLGVDERKRYLIILQNPTELRSTGGWISSYAIIGLEGGQIRELEVDDVYNLDGELINQEKFFEAPADMQKALNIKEWNLSLSNWDPNFQDTANNAAFFVAEAGKAQNLNGVISIDINFLQALLTRWGGINIPGENELITSDNIYEKIFSIHHDFSPGESQKATFLANLANETLKKLLSSNTEEYSLVMPVILESLEHKNILVFLNNAKGQEYFSDQGWDGLVDVGNHSAIPFSIEWNWGANKANLYIEREERIQAEIRNIDEIHYTYSLLLKNNSTSEAYPQGEYTNYVRIYMPENSEITSTRGFQNNQFEKYNDKGFQVIGGWFNIPIQTTKELQIRYIATQTEQIFRNINNDILMPIHLLKQPGTKNTDKIRLEIFYPETWSIIEQRDFNKLGIQLTNEWVLDTDKYTELRWRYR